MIAKHLGAGRSTRYRAFEVDVVVYGMAPTSALAACSVKPSKVRVVAVGAIGHDPDQDA